jgi:lipopolysaccharide transport system permease protein
MMHRPIAESRSGAPAALAFAWRNRYLLASLTRREILGRYRGSWLGMFWTLLNPLLMLGIYTFIFGMVFQVRWDADQGIDAQFAAILFTGIILHGILGEVLSRSPTSVVSNANFVKKVVFPLELLGWVTVVTAFFHFLLALAVLAMFLLLTGHGIPGTAVALPLVVAPLLLLALGVAWFVSSLGVYVRDTGHVTGFISVALMFLSPIFYPLTALPEAYRDLFFLNPLTFVIVETRNVLLMGQWPGVGALTAYWVVALIVFWLGHLWFQKTRGGFADVL